MKGQKNKAFALFFIIIFWGFNGFFASQKSSASVTKNAAYAGAAAGWNAMVPFPVHVFGNAIVGQRVDLKVTYCDNAQARISLNGIPILNSGASVAGCANITQSLNFNLGAVFAGSLITCEAGSTDGNPTNASCEIIFKDPSCTINSTNPNPAEVISGNPVTINYSTFNANVVSLSDGTNIWNILSGTNINRIVNPTAPNPIPPAMTYNYTISVSGPGGGPNTCSTTVELLPRCAISSAPANIASGDDIDLTYTTWDATSGVIDSNPASASFPMAAAIQAIDGTPTTFPETYVTPPITYTMTVTAVNGKANTCQVTVNPLTTCTLTSPTTPATPIVDGTPANLTWTSNGAASATLTPPGVAVAVNGNMNVTPAVTTTYKLDVTGSGTNFCTATVHVIPLVTPVCNSFTTSLTTLNVGQATQLTWAATDAIKADIDYGIGNVMPVPAGQIFFYPTVAGTYPLTMTVTSTSGTTATCSTANITVNPASAIPINTQHGNYKEFNKSTNIILNDVARTLLSFMGGVALLVFIASGIYFMMSRGNPEIYGKAKKMFLYAIMGLLIILLSYAILVVIESFAV